MTRHQVRCFSVLFFGCGKYISLLFLSLFFGHVISFVSFIWEGGPLKWLGNQKWAFNQKSWRAPGVAYSTHEIYSIYRPPLAD